MIALLLAIPGADTSGLFNVTEFAGETVRSVTRGARKLSLVPKVEAPAAGGLLTVAQFCQQRGVSLTVGCMSRIGRKASALTRAAGQVPGRAVEAFGEVNTYDAAVLAQAFAFVEAATH